jgi:DNA topoisomerase-1
MEQTPVYMSAPIEKAQYIHRIEVPLFWGWKVVSTGDTNTVSLAETGAALLLYMTQSPKEQEAQKICAKVAVHGRRTHYTEASLIKRLEDIGIGRPSTYASLVDTIIERGYVKKMDIDGDIIACSEYVLEKGRDIVETQLEKRVGQEKGKLVIQPVGILVAEFLTEHFGGLFDYDYTKGMELELDKIAAAEGATKDLCGECDSEIERMILPIEKQRFVIKDNVDNYVVMGRYGPVIQKKGSRELTGVRKDIDMERLKAGDYSLGELLEKKEVDEIGVWEGEPVVLKSGPFGQYVCYKEEKISLNILGLEKGSTQEEIYSAFMTKKTEVGVEGEDKKVIRELSPEMSIRNGKYGAYIHYFKQGMKKPKFFALKGFKESYRLCQKEVLMEWITKTHGV